MASKKSPELVADGAVDTAALAEYAGQVRAAAEDMGEQLAEVGTALAEVEHGAPDDQDTPPALRANARRLAAAVDDTARALRVVVAACAELAREAL
jgi:hypothetical protein